LKFGKLSSELLLQVSELFFFDATDSHLKNFLDEGVLGNDKLRLERSESFSNLLDLTGTNIGESSENDLLVGSE